jgi:hypothetical protein
MHPKEIHLDFEVALAAGFSNIFPYVSIMQDFFHFMQANVKKLGQLGMTGDVNDVVEDLRALWYKPTKIEFNTNLEEFLSKWDRLSQGYTPYFRTTWVKRFSPQEWASCARSSDARSGIIFVFFDAKMHTNLTNRFWCCRGIQ